MTIIPDITANATLDGSSFDTTLSYEKAMWLEKIRSTWVACKFWENAKQYFLSAPYAMRMSVGFSHYILICCCCCFKQIKKALF